MADTILDSSAIDNGTAKVFIEKIDMACIALNNPNQHFEGYGVGVNAAYKLLCEAQAISPNNQAIATEIASLRRIMDQDTNNNNAQKEASSGRIMEAEINASNTESITEKLMQQWHTKPVIEIVVFVNEQHLTSLATTIDSISTQLYNNWKLTVISNMPSPGAVFSEHDILTWVQTNDFQKSINETIESSTADWTGIIPVGSALDNTALFNVAEHDNQKGEQWQIIYALDSSTTGDKSACDGFQLQKLISGDLVGEFCFFRNALMKKIDVPNIKEGKLNNSLVISAVQHIPTSAIGYLPNRLIQCAAPLNDNNQALSSNVA